MKITLFPLLLLISLTAGAQKDSVKAPQPITKTYKKYTVIATASLGFMDYNRTGYSVPSGYEKGDISGFAPFFARLEYGLSDHISIAASMCYDVYTANIRKDYTGNSGPFTLYITNQARVYSGGIIGFYHLGDYIRVPRLDPFIGLGLELNNIRYNNAPQGDTTAIVFSHPLTAYYKVGARYYLSDQFSLYGDLGFEKEAMLTIGVSCRFRSRKLW